MDSLDGLDSAAVSKRRPRLKRLKWRTSGEGRVQGIERALTLTTRVDSTTLDRTIDLAQHAENVIERAILEHQRHDRIDLGTRRRRSLTDRHDTKQCQDHHRDTTRDA